MKKYLIALLILFSIKLNGKNIDEKVLLLVNPTVGSLKTFHQMVEKKILDIPNLKIIGIYDMNHNYNFDKSNQYLQDENINYIHLQGYDLDISIDSLFVPNRKTKIFYQLFLEADGILFTGGPDIPPSVYSKKTHLTTGYIPAGRLYELSFLFHLLGGSQNSAYSPFLEEKQDFIVLGICLGMQMMNVATGGTLFQDIPSEIYQIYYVEDIFQLTKNQQHRNYWPQISYGKDFAYFNIHLIDLMSSSIFRKMSIPDIQSDYYIISSHHQCVDKLGQHLKVAALSMDKKIIEAVEHSKYKNVYGVQFHPEYWGIYNSEYQFKFAPDDEKHAIEDELGEESMKFHRIFWMYFSELFMN